MRAHIIACVLASGCGRIGFDTAGLGAGPDATSDATSDASSACGGATFCDEFERTVPIAPGDPIWTNVMCSAPGAALAVDGALEISYPAFGGAGVALCQLGSRLVTDDIRTVEVDFDLAFATAAPTNAVVFIANPHIQLAQANAAGIDDLSFQLGINGFGDGQLNAVYHYPIAAMSPTGTNFPGFNLADSYGDATRWMTPGMPCHVVLAIDASVPSATAVSACGAAHALTANPNTLPTGITGPMTLNFGYSVVSSATSAGSLVYDHLSVKTSP